MLKFDAIIRNLSLDEKISLITSSVKYKNSFIENYSLPQFEIEDFNNIFKTEKSDFVSYGSLLSSWDKDLIRKTINTLEQIRREKNDSRKIIGIKVNSKSKGFAPDNYLLGQSAKIIINELSNMDSLVSVTDFPKINIDNLDIENVKAHLMALEAKPFSVIINSIDSLRFVNELTGYKGYKFFDASNDNDAIASLNNGAVLVFYEDAKEAILNAIDNYEVEFKKYRSNQISSSEFEKLKDNGIIISENKLDEVLNDYFEMLLKVDEHQQKMLDYNSIKVLKNDTHDVPLYKFSSIYVFGDFANRYANEEFDYEKELEGIMGEHNLNYMGFNSSYAFDSREENDEKKKIMDSEYVVVFLNQYDENKYVLPHYQVDLLESLSKLEKKVIGIIDYRSAIDFSFSKYCTSLIQASISNNDVLKSVFNILVGKGEKAKEELEANKKYTINSNDIYKSIIMLKNDETLPIEPTSTISIVGDFANNFKINNSIVQYDISKILSKYDLNVTGLAHGFVSDDVDNEPLYEEALRLSQNAEYVLLFLGQYDDNLFNLPKKELDLIDYLYDAKKKIIAIVNSENIVDYSFADKCNAIIQSNLLSDYAINAIIDCIIGKYSPSGAITFNYFKNPNEEVDVFNNDTYYYALGHGLNYGIVDYFNFKVEKQGVSFVVTNNSAKSIIENPQLYISKLDSEKKDIKLCGFGKVSLQFAESARVFIPFDEDTFKTFDTSIKKFKIEKGKYAIMIGSSLDNIVYTESIELDEYIYDYYTSKQDVELQVNEKVALQNLTKNTSRKALHDLNKDMSFAKKLLIAIFVALYYNALFGFILYANLTGSNSLIVTITSISLLAIFDILLVIYIIIQAKKPKEEEIDYDDDLEKTITYMENFDKLADIEYPRNVVEPVIEEEIKDEEEKEETIEEEVTQEVVNEVEATYDKRISINEDDTDYSEYIDFEEYANDLTNYCLNSGLIVEPRSIRSILGAIASSKMIFLKSQNNDLTLKFCELLTKYMNLEFNPIDTNSLDMKEKLFWQIDDKNVFSRTNLANVILQAWTNKNKIYLETIYNVDVENMDYFDNFINYATDPNNSDSVNVGDSEVEDVLINKNIIFLMISNDELFMEKLDKRLVDASVSIELFIRENEIISEEPTINYTLSYKLLEDKIKKNREKFFIDEDNWKKFDDVEDDIKNFEKFSIDNRMTLLFEKLVAVMLEAGSDITEAIDYCIASKIVPYIKTLTSYKNAIDESNFKNILLNHFGEDVLPVSERELKKPL